MTTLRPGPKRKPLSQKKIAKNVTLDRKVFEKIEKKPGRFFATKLNSLLKKALGLSVLLLTLSGCGSDSVDPTACKDHPAKGNWYDAPNESQFMALESCAVRETSCGMEGRVRSDGLEITKVAGKAGTFCPNVGNYNCNFSVADNNLTLVCVNKDGSFNGVWPKFTP